jgi:hypothetical protein|tara:strand:+ start:1565 stop:1993 length:429 start_codon:yes stop_codon:yes gene_type:complete
MKKNIFILILSFFGVGISFGQAEISGGFGSVAAADIYGNSVSSSVGQLSFDYDFLADSNLRASVGTDILIGQGGLGIAPGIKIGLDFINLKVNYDFDNTIWYGLGSRIGLGSVHGINIGLQGAVVDDIGLGWVSIGYSFRFQ